MYIYNLQNMYIKYVYGICNLSTKNVAKSRRLIQYIAEFKKLIIVGKALRFERKAPKNMTEYAKTSSAKFLILIHQNKLM